jgi:hypothetical protein
MDAATRRESELEDFIDGLVNEIASSGLPELDVVRRGDSARLPDEG